MHDGRHPVSGFQTYGGCVMQKCHIPFSSSFTRRVSICFVSLVTTWSPGHSWTQLVLDTAGPGHSWSWTQLVLDTAGPGHSWTQLVLDTAGPGHSWTWTQLDLDTAGHSWTQLDTAGPGHSWTQLDLEVGWEKGKGLQEWFWTNIWLVSNWLHPPILGACAPAQSKGFPLLWGQEYLCLTCGLNKSVPKRGG